MRGYRRIDGLDIARTQPAAQRPDQCDDDRDRDAEQRERRDARILDRCDGAVDKERHHGDAR
jgi:hypothetical protein